MLKSVYTIKVHSFIDLITNSSSSVFVQATDKTVQSVKEIIDNILTLGGSELKCDDLFEVSIDKQGLYDNYYQDQRDEGEEVITPEEFYEKNQDCDNPNSVYLLVKCKDEKNKIGKTTAKVLSGLTGLFELDARYD